MIKSAATKNTRYPGWIGKSCPAQIAGCHSVGDRSKRKTEARPSASRTASTSSVIMIAASSAAWLGDLRRAIGGPNSVAAVYPALIGLETDSDAAMVISLKAFSLLAAGVTPRPCQERYSFVHLW